jgi:hypothetical protein
MFIVLPPIRKQKFGDAQSELLTALTLPATGPSASPTSCQAFDQFWVPSLPPKLV